MKLTIRVHNVIVLDHEHVDQGPHLQAVGYMPSGQVLVRSAIVAGHSPSVKAMAVKDVADWVRANRPSWDIETLPGEGITTLAEFIAASRAKEPRP